MEAETACGDTATSQGTWTLPRLEETRILPRSFQKEPGPPDALISNCYCLAEPWEMKAWYFKTPHSG